MAFIPLLHKQVNIQILIVNTVFYIYSNVRLKEISILNFFEQIQENIILGLTFSAQLGSSAVAFIPNLSERLNMSLLLVTWHYIVITICSLDENNHIVVV